MNDENEVQYPADTEPQQLSLLELPEETEKTMANVLNKGPLPGSYEKPTGPRLRRDGTPWGKPGPKSDKVYSHQTKKIRMYDEVNKQEAAAQQAVPVQAIKTETTLVSQGFSVDNIKGKLTVEALKQMVRIYNKAVLTMMAERAPRDTILPYVALRDAYIEEIRRTVPTYQYE